MSNNNPTGINQYKDCPSATDDEVNDLIKKFHREGVTSRATISQLLSARNIKMSQATVARRFKLLGLKGAGAAEKSMTPEGARQLVLDQMAQDPARRQGPSTIKEKIAIQTGTHLTRETIRREMRLQDPDGFTLREPSSKKVHRGVLHCLGPHHEWSADGHDKLAAIGFPIWGARDKWSGKWLKLWVIPNNRLKLSIAYLYLSLVAKLGGMPIQSTTDRGSETTLMYGLASALREYVSPELSEAGIGPAHVFLQSVHNITIERGWLQLARSWAGNVKIHWESGNEVYDPSDPKQYDLVQWLWPKLIQQELDKFVEEQNAHKVRSDKAKMNPSGVSPNVAFDLYEMYGGKNCLQPVDPNVVHELMDQIGGEDLVRFVSEEYALRVQSIYDSLGPIDLSFANVWDVFTRILPML